MKTNVNLYLFSYRFREFDDSQVETYHITKRMVDKAKAKIDVKSLYATTSSEQMSVLAKEKAKLKLKLFYDLII